MVSFQQVARDASPKGYGRLRSITIRLVIQNCTGEVFFTDLMLQAGIVSPMACLRALCLSRPTKQWCRITTHVYKKAVVQSISRSWHTWLRLWGNALCAMALPFPMLLQACTSQRLNHPSSVHLISQTWPTHVETVVLITRVKD